MSHRYIEKEPKHDDQAPEPIQGPFKCPRCGAPLMHFTQRGFPYCSNKDCFYLVIPEDR